MLLVTLAVKFKHGRYSKRSNKLREIHDVNTLNREHGGQCMLFRVLLFTSVEQIQESNGALVTG